MDAVGQLAAALAGRYTVDREIGRGGMATVYLARDVRHNRKVALKVLNPELGAVLGVERFLAEIQVTANLQHPNLLPLFDSGEANGLLFYVMPFVEGESLRATLGREKQLGIDDAVRIATSVAAALDYAHRHGVIHRDLKPENILMHDGQPLVADFGIALAVSNAGGDRITQTGLSLGTPQYMSPEQATGDREVDGRTDLYSLGALTYEMLTGEPPHDGKTSQAIIARILTEKPRSLRLVRETVPPHIDSAVLRALAKLPADRFHTAHEFADALQGRSLATTASMAATARQAPQWRSMIPWAVATLALAIAAVAWRRSDGSTDAARVMRYEISLPPNIDVTSSRYSTVAVGPGGRHIAYVATRGDGFSRILLRADDDLEPRQVPGTEGAISVAFSPEGSQLLFMANGTLRKVPISGGRVETIVENAAAFRGASWSSSGWIIGSDGNSLVKIPAVGGTAALITHPDTANGETFQINPVVLGDGQTILYTSSAMGGAVASRIGVATMGGESSILDLPGASPLGVVDGFLVYASAAGTLMAAPFDVASRRLTGPPMALPDQSAISSAFGSTFAYMALDGTIVYVTGALRRQAVMVSPDGNVSALGEPGLFSWPRFSPDGKRIAMSVGNLAQRDVFVVDRWTGQPTQLTFGEGSNDRPEWSLDGSTIFFRSTRESRNGIWSARPDGSAATKVFGRPDSHIDEGVMAPDGKSLVVQRDSTGNAELWHASLDGSNTFRPVHPGQGVYGGRFSPDGKWVVFTSTQTGEEQVFVKSFPALGNFTRVSLTGGGTPVWSPDGKKLYYVNGEQLIAATIGSTNPFTIASRQVVLSRGYNFLGVHADYDVARDGTIIAFQPPSGLTQLVVVRNIGAELKTRLRAAPR
jgi:eukaryotic-like serine/threonine-protein kinase